MIDPMPKSAPLSPLLPLAAFVLFLLPLAFVASTDRASAAEFDIDAARILLRRLQYCQDCGSALLVTRVHSGVMVRCPDCGREQPRLADQYLLTQVYQLCRVCEFPLDPAGHATGDAVECANCHTRQILSRDAFPRGENVVGLGYAPGFLPGSGKKKLLFSPNHPDAPITPVPLDDMLADLAPPRSVIPEIPRPPVVSQPAVSVAAPAAPPRPEAPALPELAPPAPLLSAIPSPPAPGSGEAMEVPAVTVDLFGGKRSGGGDKAGFIPTGNVVARVDGTPIHAAEVERVMAPILARLRERAGPEAEAEIATREPALRREVLERLIDRELAIKEAAAIGYRPDPAAVRERETELAHIFAGGGGDLRREAERDVTMAEMRRRFAEKPGAANPEAVREFYRQNKDKLLRPRLLAMSQLVVYEERAGRVDLRNYREIAQEVALALEGGRRFDELRRRYDEFGPALGMPLPEPELQPENAYAASILQSAGDLRKGAVFGPLFMEGIALFGKVTDEQPAGPVPFEEVEKDIRKKLEAEAAENTLDAWLKRLRQKAKVEIYDNIR